MPKKIFTTKDGFTIQDIDNSIIGINDVLVEVMSSFYSPGTEEASAKKISESLIKKSFRFRDQVVELIAKGDLNTLYKKFKNQNSTKLPTGYSLFGKILDTGNNVKNLRTGQYVVCLGDKANHGSVAVVPQGMAFPCDNNINYSCISLLSIALNSALIGNFNSFSNILVLGGGLLGQFIIQILSSMGHNVSVVEIRDELRKTSCNNGANQFFELDDYKLYENEFDGVISTLPSLTQKMWEDVATMLKISSNFILVGAADINISRKIFYSKRLNFLTAYSYGSGRGEFEYEQLANHHFTNYKSGPSIKTLVNKGLKLLKENKVKIDFIDKIDMQNLDGNIDSSIKKRKLGFNFIWNNNEENKFLESLNSLHKEKNTNQKYNGFDVIGDSAFFRDSHKPSLKKLGINLGVVKTRSPKSKINLLKKSNTNSVIISSPHAEHWNNIKSEDYSFIFVDKPIITNKSEYNEYVSSKSKIVALMNRRYSEYTKLIKDFVSKNPKKSTINFSFNVPKKNPQDPIFFSGGRLIGEMCHHIDLAIFISGPVVSIKELIIDSHRDAQKSENCQLIMKHKNGAISNITYTTNISPFWGKEAVWATIGNNFILNKDFKSISSNFIIKNSIKENDKGCLNMWNLIDEKLKRVDEFDDFIKLDRQTYKILNQILF